MIWELVAFNTDSRYREDVRYRAYTSSADRAEAFSRIPKIQFTDSGHGIVFDAREHPNRGARKPAVRSIQSYVNEHLPALVRAVKKERADA